MSQPNPLSDEQLSKIETLVDAAIQSRVNVHWLDATPEEEALQDAVPPEVLGSLVAEVRSLRAEKAERDAREPDHCYDAENWECSYHWSDRDALFDDHGLAPGEIRRVGTLFNGPDRHVTEIPIAFDDEGDPDDWETRWFNTKEEAQAAIDAARAEGE